MKEIVDRRQLRVMVRHLIRDVLYRDRAEWRKLLAKARSIAQEKPKAPPWDRAALATYAQAAPVLGVSRHTVRKLIDKGCLTAVWIGRLPRVTPDSLNRLIAEGTGPVKPAADGETEGVQPGGCPPRSG